MPIHPDMKARYPADWRAISDRIRFDRAGRRCERCGRPHRRLICALKDGRWHDPRELAGWFDRAGKPVPAPSLDALRGIRYVRVVLSTAHLDHDPANSDEDNLAALCQRCHLAHDKAHHGRQRWLRWRMRWAIRDLFS